MNKDAPVSYDREESLLSLQESFPPRTALSGPFSNWLAFCRIGD